MINKFLLFLLLEVVFVELGLGLVPLMDLELKHVVVVLDGLVLLCALILQDLQLILQDFDSFLELSEILGGVLNEIDVFVPCGLHFFVECLEVLQFVACFFVFFGEVKYQKFLNFEFLTGFSDLSSGS